MIYLVICLRVDLFTIVGKAVKTVSPFSYLKALTHVYLTKTFMAHNKYLIFLIFEDNDSISAKSAAEILSLNLE